MRNGSIQLRSLSIGDFKRDSTKSKVVSVKFTVQGKKSEHHVPVAEVVFSEWHPEEYLLCYLN